MKSMYLNKFRSAMTLMEIIMVVVLIGILATLGVVNFRKTVLNSRIKEAQSLLLLIRHAEDVVRSETNTFVNCANTANCNTVLRLNLPEPATPTWTYSVASADADSFCATATPAGGSGLSTYRIWQGQDVATTVACP
jgi:prepilin-type N-terminal cleavage/methylation domain-containing protein